MFYWFWRLLFLNLRSVLLRLLNLWSFSILRFLRFLRLLYIWNIRLLRLWLARFLRLVWSLRLLWFVRLCRLTRFLRFLRFLFLLFSILDSKYPTVACYTDCVYFISRLIPLWSSYLSNIILTKF